MGYMTQDFSRVLICVFVISITQLWLAVHNRTTINNESFNGKICAPLLLQLGSNISYVSLVWDIIYKHLVTKYG